MFMDLEKFVDDLTSDDSLTDVSSLSDLDSDRWPTPPPSLDHWHMSSGSTARVHRSKFVSPTLSSIPKARQEFRPIAGSPIADDLEIRPEELEIYWKAFKPNYSMFLWADQYLIRQESQLMLQRFKSRPRPIRKINREPDVFCALCEKNGQPAEVFRSHALKDAEGNVTCPTLKSFTCPICGIKGAHTRSHCPSNKCRTRKVRFSK